ncbi:MAG: anaerobic ribonucleoside-triphosphate reductase activating protein [Patescibacteria group bacterium]|nr:anaerobic ribonucleoside-triphosphate reductase activating protein [Patescibacteria group bacterium]
MSIVIKGLQKFSLIDYKDKTAAVIFTGGCNFNCVYCHNRELISYDKKNMISEKEILNFLQTRIKLLDAVSISGGEPTLQKDLLYFIKKIKKMGFLIKLDTNGTNPEMLENLINKNLIDYVAMDIKAPLDLKDYEKIIKVKNKNLIEAVKKSVKILLREKIDYEFRTTVAKDLLSKKDIEKIAREIKGAKKYYLQNFVKTEKISYNKLNPMDKNELEELKSAAEEYVLKCEIRD